ncbi:MAG TPA: outer membrane beta-barrel protein [Bryobacteraceae bacterium]|nr:outer membrane beta-barrel protein [Bryobacteraceae bacterium]
MKRRMYFFALSCLVALPLCAQTSRFAWQVGGGFSEPVKDLGHHLDTGWNATAGAGVNLDSHVGVMVDFMYNHFGINRTSLNEVQAPNGTAGVWAFTLDPIVRFAPHGHVGFYVTGGGGVYHRTVEFTQPAIADVTLFDPWFGVFFPSQVVTNQVIGSFSVTKPGFNIGAGVTFRVGDNSQFYAETRYHKMFTDRVNTTILPVTFGFRW